MLKPFSNIIAPNRFQVPTGRLRMDWANPITRSMLGCWVPGAMGTVDVCGKAPRLTEFIHASDPRGFVRSGQEGPGLYTWAGGAYDGGYYGLAPLEFKSWNEFTIYYRGHNYGSSDGAYACVSHNNTAAAPYAVLYLGQSSGTDLAALWNDNGQYSYDYAGSVAANGLVSGGVVAKVGTGVTLYDKGVGTLLDGFDLSSPPAYSDTATIYINQFFVAWGVQTRATCYMAAFWNRALSSQEMAWLDQNPYEFLLPEQPALFFIPGKPLTLYDTALDAGLSVLSDDADAFHLCVDRPRTYAETTTFSIGSGNIDFGEPGAATPPPGRTVAAAATTGTATATGVATHWAAVDSVGEVLLAAGLLSDPVELVDEQAFNLDAVSIVQKGIRAQTYFGLLDNYPNATAAFSLRRLSGSYEGPAVRIRRSSDNAEQDFGFLVNGDFNAAAVATFIGGGTGYAAKWYDQSGNVRNAAQTTANRQPVYIASGVNGKPSLDFLGYSAGVWSEIDITGVNLDGVIDAASGYSIFAFRLDTTEGTMWCDDQNGRADPWFHAGAYRAEAYDGSQQSATQAVNTTTDYVGEWGLLSGTLFGCLNGGTDATDACGSISNLTGTPMQIGYGWSTAYALNGRLSELIFWAGNPGRAAVRSDLMAYY